MARGLLTGKKAGEKWEKSGRKHRIKKILLIIFSRYAEIAVYCNFSC
jgi:hypothetical protein